MTPSNVGIEIRWQFVKLNRTNYEKARDFSLLMEANRLRPLLNHAISCSSQLHRLRFISSSAFVGQRAWGFFSDDPEGGSAVYRHVLKFQQPSTIKYRPQLHNSVSFIGTINRRLTRINIGNGRFGVHTTLNVKTSRYSNQSFG